MAHGVAMLLGAAKNKWKVIGAPSTVATSTAATAVRMEEFAHLFTMADHNEVIVYFDGTNIGYRIKASGTWGAFTNLLGSPSLGSESICARNGDNIYVAYDNAGAVAVQVVRLAYASGAITQTQTTAPVGAGTSGFSPMGIYWDATNSYIHVMTGTNGGVYLHAWDGALTTKYDSGSTLGVAAQTHGYWSCIAGSGSSSFFALVVGTTTFTSKAITANAGSYTLGSNDTGTPTGTSLQGITTFYDGTNIYVVANDNNATLKLSKRNNATSWDAFTTIATSTLASLTTPGSCVSGSDVVLFYRRNNTQANGEIYYLRRLGGVWDADPGTRFAGGAATGWQTPSSTFDDLNASQVAKLVYLTGTASPFTITENSLS